MREAETVESAIKIYSSHVTLHAEDFVIFVDKATDCPIVVAQFLKISREQSVQALQFAITGLVMQIRWLTGTEFCPEFIAYSYGKPKRFHDGLTLFKCPVLFNQAVSGIGISDRMLAHSLVTSPPFLRKLAMQQLGPLLNPPHSSFKTRVSPQLSPHSVTAINPRNSPLLASISVNRCRSGISRCSGMFGISS